VVDQDGDGAVSLSDFLGFYLKLEHSEVPTEDLDRLFEYLDASGAGTILKESFMQLARLFYSVISQTVLTDTLSVKESKTVRRMDVGEVVEVTDAPAKDESVGVMRVPCRAVRDAAVGWATIIGNKETVFLKPCRNLYRVIKDMPLLAGRSTDSAPLRSLKVDDLVEVLEWDQKDELTGAWRVRVRVKGDGIVGWATKQLAREGAVYLQLA